MMQPGGTDSCLVYPPAHRQLGRSVRIWIMLFTSLALMFLAVSGLVLYYQMWAQPQEPWPSASCSGTELMDLNGQPDVVFRNAGLRRATGGDVVQFRQLHRALERAVFGEAVHQAGQ